jgi:hypothetical protein
VNHKATKITKSSHKDSSGLRVEAIAGSLWRGKGLGDPMTWRCGLWLVAAGITISLAGLLYGVVFVGVPYQEPTPVQRSSEAFHYSVSGGILLAGVGITLLGLLSLAIRLLVGSSRSRIGKADANS